MNVYKNAYVRSSQTSYPPVCAIHVRTHRPRPSALHHRCLRTLWVTPISTNKSGPLYTACSDSNDRHDLAHVDAVCGRVYRCRRVLRHRQEEGSSPQKPASPEPEQREPGQF